MFKNEVLERFLRYVVVDTMSDEALAEKKHPSTEGQWNLLRLLEKELRDLGLKDVELDQHGYLLARVEATAPGLDAIAFSSHVDTADAVSGNGVKPVVNEYMGGDLLLKSGLKIEAEGNPELAQYVGSKIITSDGTTLLGCDDKGGVAEIMTAVAYLVEHPEVKHGEVEILFSPDEETGFGMNFFDAKKLHAKAFYTVDGGDRYSVEVECFNAATVRVHFTGVAYHLGAARGRLVNALTMASAFVNAIPQAESPEATDGRFGYYCAQMASGNATEMEVTLYLRDFDYENLMRRVEALRVLGRAIEALYVGGRVEVDAQVRYLNMGEAAKQNPRAVDAIFDAGRVLGQPLTTQIIRGGTDGARIAEKLGIACPNLYTGGHNMHSLREWAALDAMNDSVQLILEIVKQWGK